MYESKLIGKTFEEMPCYEMVRAYYRLNGQEVPPYTDLLDHGRPRTGIGFKRILEPVAGCMCVYSLQGKQIDHVGIYLGGNRLLHSTEGSGVCIERYSKYLSRLKGLYVWSE